jgi:hypothetical protein
VSGSKGDGPSLDIGGEDLREDENQEGIGLLHDHKPVVQRHGFPEGRKP